MVRVLLTGGSGFIAAHVLDTLLEHGHSVVTTVRSQQKAKQIQDAHPGVPTSKLDFAIVEDISKNGAFDKAVQSDPPFEAVIHTASPFQIGVADVQRDLLDPAIVGTTGILKAVKAHAPSVKRIVITSSFAAVKSQAITTPGYKYSEKDWNPITKEEALQNPASGYTASKKLAEKAAWEFVETEKPKFSLSTINPPMVYGPVVHHLSSLDSLNTSNQRIRNLIQGKNKEEIPDSGVFLWVDVRDAALAHVRAVEVPEAAGKRFLATAGLFSNKEIADIIRKNFPNLVSKLPTADTPGGDFPEGGSPYSFDNTRSRELLGIKFRTLTESIVDTVKSLQAIGA
ncbi:MAG: methylglyoxal reductase (NADPH-dependent) gre2 [Thelocarpon superellum]|nr:MAG: methylglyoxal reductase (NADPH-dependent) gre2 [Thelocarpon superellum]